MANIIDSYSQTNQDSSRGLRTGVYTADGESFTGNGATLGSSVFCLSKTGSPTGNAVSKIYDHSGTFGTNGVPTGAALATSDNFDVSTLTGSFALSTFNFSGANQITLTNATKYVVVVEYTGGSAGNQVNVGLDSTSPTAAGNTSYFISGSWGSEATDTCFYVYDNAGADPAPSVSDSSTVTESVGFYSELVATRESSKAELNSSINISDSVTLTENIGRLLTSFVNVSDSVTVTENTKVELNSRIAVSDSVTITENVVVTIATVSDKTVTTSDSVTITESVSVQLGMSLAVTDNVTLSESIGRLLTSFITTSDSATITESIKLLGQLSIATSDSVAVTEAIASLLTANINVSDAITATENVVVVSQQPLSIAVSDSGAISEIVAVSVVDALPPTYRVRRGPRGYRGPRSTIGSRPYRGPRGVRGPRPSL